MATANVRGVDGLLETEHLEGHGGQEGLAVEGKPVCIYGVQCDNENSWGRHIGGPAFLAPSGNIGCSHA